MPRSVILYVSGCLARNKLEILEIYWHILWIWPSFWDKLIWTFQTQRDNMNVQNIVIRLWRDSPCSSQKMDGTPNFFDASTVRFRIKLHWSVLIQQAAVAADLRHFAIEKYLHRPKDFLEEGDGVMGWVLLAAANGCFAEARDSLVRW